MEVAGGISEADLSVFVVNQKDSMRVGAALFFQSNCHFMNYKVESVRFQELKPGIQSTLNFMIWFISSDHIVHGNWR